MLLFFAFFVYFINDIFHALDIFIFKIVFSLVCSIFITLSLHIFVVTVLYSSDLVTMWHFISNSELKLVFLKYFYQKKRAKMIMQPCFQSLPGFFFLQDSNYYVYKHIYSQSLFHASKTTSLTSCQKKIILTEIIDLLCHQYWSKMPNVPN